MSRIFLAITLCLAFLAVSVDAQDNASRSKRFNSKRSNKSSVRKRSRLSAGGQPVCDPTPYPALPQSEQAKGRVTVQVLIDEEGKVISARALSGDARFHRAAVDAALKERFSPTKLSGQPVKITGVITFHFTEQGAITKESDSH
jgi:TonB family protein